MKAIYKQHRKRRGRSKYLLSVEAAVVKGEESLPVRLVFVRNRNHRKDWLVLVTTDMSLTAEEVIRIYGKRWGIEVFFKVCKSFLRLEKDCRSLSYDAMTAHVSIVFTRYMFLAVEQPRAKMHEVWESCSIYPWMSCRMCASWKPCASFCCCLLNDSKRSLCWMKGRSMGSCKAS